ncbi:MAG: dCTP deaminase [Thaumarchaeota archaeon]|nr:dCTP deaminase [Nitrososphaerota archaeon]
MILTDWEIKALIDAKKLIIEPLSNDVIQPNGIDLSVGHEVIRISSNGPTPAIREGEKIRIGPGERCLVSTLERLEMPSDLVGLVNIRSSYSRRGMMSPPTVIDAGFKGKLTFLIIGTAHKVELKVGDRFWHIVLARTKTVAKPYQGKYQESAGVEGFESD